MNSSEYLESDSNCNSFTTQRTTQFTMSKDESNAKAAAAVEDDDEPDEWYVCVLRLLHHQSNLCRDKRIYSTGCAGKSRTSMEMYGNEQELTEGRHVDENMKMTDCYFEKKDWRLCKAEVRSFTLHLALSRMFIYLLRNSFLLIILSSRARQ